jgi:hypothetical protein
VGRNPISRNVAALNLVDPPAGAVGDAEDLSCGVELDVLGAAAGELEVSNDRPGTQVHLHQLGRELTGRHEIGTVGREVDVIHPGTVDRQGLQEGERMRIPEVQAPLSLGHHNRGPPIRGEVEVVGISHGDVRPRRLGGERVDRGQAVVEVVGDVERL